MELNSIQELIKDIAAGKMVVLMDDEDRENEGDLILAAEKVSPEAINFMATHARGLICLALNDERCKRLGLEQMVKNNGTELGTAFTGSIEAATGVTTGISAGDRSTTIQAAVSKDAVPEDIVNQVMYFLSRLKMVVSDSRWPYRSRNRFSFTCWFGSISSHSGDTERR